MADSFQLERITARAELGEQLSRSELRILLHALEVQRAAIAHVLDQAQRDPKGLGYYVGPRMRSFELLCEAEALTLGKPVADVMRERGS